MKPIKQTGGLLCKFNFMVLFYIFSFIHCFLFKPSFHVGIEFFLIIYFMKHFWCFFANSNDFFCIFFTFFVF